MNKKVALVALVLVVAFGAAGCGKKSDQLKLTVNDSSDASAMEKFSGSMNELLSRGKAMKCDFTVSDKDYKQTSTIYVDGKNMRLDGVITMAGQPETKTHMIADESYNYIWSEDKTGMGIKMKTGDVNANAGDSTAKAEDTKVDMNMKLDMDCGKWSPDATVFTPPSDVKFSDFSEMLNSLTGGNMCGSCDFLEGKDKTECQTNFCKK